MRQILVFGLVFFFAVMVSASACSSDVDILKAELKNELVTHYAAGFCANFSETFKSENLMPAELPKLTFKNSELLTQAHKDYVAELTHLGDLGDKFNQRCISKQYTAATLKTFDAIIQELPRVNKKFRNVRGILRLISQDYVDKIEQVGGDLESVSNQPLHADYTYLKSYLNSVPLNYFEVSECGKINLRSDSDFIDLSNNLYCVVDFKTQKLTEIILLTSGYSAKESFQNELDTIANKNSEKIGTKLPSELQTAVDVLPSVLGCAMGSQLNGPLAVLSGCADGINKASPISDTITSFLNNYFGNVDCDEFYSGMKSDGQLKVAEIERNFDTLLSKLAPARDFSQAYESLSLSTKDTILFRQVRQFNKIDADLLDFKLSYAITYADTKAELNKIKQILSVMNDVPNNVTLLMNKLNLSKSIIHSRELSSTENKYRALQSQFDRLGHCTDTDYGCYGQELSGFKEILTSARAISIDTVTAAPYAGVIFACKSKLTQFSEEMNSTLAKPISLVSDEGFSQTFELKKLESKKYSELVLLKDKFNSISKSISTENLDYSIDECNRALAVHDAFIDLYSKAIVATETATNNLELSKCISELGKVIEYSKKYTDVSDANFYYAYLKQNNGSSDSLLRLCQKLKQDLLFDVENSTKYKTAQEDYSRLISYLPLLKLSTNPTVQGLLSTLKTTVLKPPKTMTDFYGTDELITKIETDMPTVNESLPASMKKYLEDNIILNGTWLVDPEYNLAIDILINNPDALPYSDSISIEKLVSGAEGISKCEIPNKPINISEIYGHKQGLIIKFNSVKPGAQHIIAKCIALKVNLPPSKINPSQIAATNELQTAIENHKLTGQNTKKLDLALAGVQSGVSFSAADASTISDIIDDTEKLAYDALVKESQQFLLTENDIELNALFDKLDIALKPTIRDQDILNYLSENPFEPIISEYQIKILKQNYSNLKLSNSLTASLARADTYASKGNYAKAYDVLANSSLKSKLADLENKKHKIYLALTLSLDKLKDDSKSELISATKLYSTITFSVDYDYDNLIKLAKADIEQGKYVNAAMYSKYLSFNLSKAAKLPVSQGGGLTTPLLIAFPILGICGVLVMKLKKKPTSKTNYLKKVFRNY